MRLLHVIHSLDPRGGGPQQAIRTFLRCAPATQAVLTLDAPGADWLPTSGCEIIPLGPAALNYGYSRRLVPWLRSHARAYDAVIIHGLWQFSSFGSFLGLRSTGVPYFVRPCGMLDPYFKQAHPLKHLKKRLYWPLERRVLQHARALLFTAPEEQRRAAHSFGPLPRPFEIVPLGIEEPPFESQAAQACFLSRFPQLQGRRFILFLGRLHPKKAPGLLIRAYGELTRDNPGLASSAPLILAGPPASEAFARQLRSLAAAQCPPGSVHFTGMLSGRLKWGAYAAADCFVLPSHQENFGISVVEALASGTPALISDQVNICGDILHAGAGLVAPDTLAGTTRLLGQWFSLTSAARAAMRSAARTCYEQSFTAEASGRSLLEALHRHVIPAPDYEPAAR